LAELVCHLAAMVTVGLCLHFGNNGVRSAVRNVLYAVRFAIRKGK